MAIEPYEGYLNLYWKGVDFSNIVYAEVDRVNINTSKRAVWRNQILYTLCDSKLCEHKANSECPMMLYKETCMCPNGQLGKIPEPRKDTKMYKDFCTLIEQIPVRTYWKQYSQFVWENKDHDCDQDDYNLLKTNPMFSMTRVSSAKTTLDEALTSVEETNDYNFRGFYNCKGPDIAISNSMRSKYREEIEAYIKLVNMDSFLDQYTIDLRNFKKNAGEFFNLCGEYVVIKIPHLTSFVTYGMQNIFVYEDSNAYYNNREYNAVRVDDFPYIYNYLINLQPNTSGGDKYQKFFVPVIKEQFPEFCSKHNIKFMQDVV